VDNCYNTVSHVAARICEQLYDGRIHPCPAGACGYHSAAEYHPGAESHVVQNIINRIDNVN